MPSIQAFMITLLFYSCFLPNQISASITPCSQSECSCGSQNATSSPTVCTPTKPSHSGSGLSKGLRYAIVIGCAVPALVSINVLIICAYKMHASSQSPHPAITELSTIVTELNHPIVKMGLDNDTIESYPKTQLGESLMELPNPNDKTCSICLCEYQHRDTIRTIPKCKHYFHANCVDEWFKKDVTCPLCRDQPNYEAHHESHSEQRNRSQDMPRPVLQNNTTTTNFLYFEQMYHM